MGRPCPSHVEVGQMPDEQTPPPTDDELARWIRSHPEVWPYADEAAPHLDEA